MATELKFPFQYTKILFTATVIMKAKTVVELGTGPGCSTEAFAKAVEITGGLVYSVDITKCLDTRNRLKGSRVVFIQNDSIKFGQTWNKGDIDILLCDSDHSYNRVYDELTTWSKWHPKLIFIHDTLSPDGKITAPYKACLEFSKKVGKKFLNFNITHGLGVIL